MAININHPRALLPGAQARIDASPLPMGPQRSDLPGMDRLFAGVHNLHQNDGFRNAFSRVQPNAVQVKAYMGKGMNKLATFSPENGIPVAKLKVKRRDADEHISARQAEKNFNKVQSGYTSLRRELRQLDLPPGQNQKGFLNALRRLFGLDKAEVQLDFKAEHVPADAPPGPGNDLAPADGLAPGPAADAAPKALPGKVQLTITSGKDPRLLGKAGEPVSFTAQDAAQYQSKVGKQKAAWLVAGGTGLAAAAVLAATVPVLGWIGGGAIAAGILIKAAFGKSPWWGKTAEGQMQKSARQEARHAADAIAEMVKRQVLCDTTEHNVGAPEGGYQKQDILSDKNMLTDFVRLARQDDPKALQKRVRAFVMSANSPLPEATRKPRGMPARQSI